MSNNFYHERDFRQSRTHVLVRGVGSEDPGGGVQLVYAEYTTHAADYPCRYLPDGWGGEPYFDADIDTLAKATDVATAIGDAVWGALGTLGWHTDGVAVGAGTAITRFHQGDLVQVDDPVEGQSDVVYPIRHVERVAGTTGHPVWALTVGDEPPDVLDLIRGITVIRPIQQALAGAGGTGGGAGLGTQGMPGTPRQVPVSRTPTNNAAAVVMPSNPDTSAVITRPGWSDPAGAPPDWVNYQLQSQVWNATGGYYEARFRVTGADGWPHPYVAVFGYLVDGTYPGGHMPYPVSMHVLDLKGTGTVQLQRNGVNVGSTHTVSGTRTVFVIAVDFAEGDDLGVVVTATSGAGVSVIVHEGGVVA